MKLKTNNRIIGADVVRCIAVFSVISVHFFLNSGFYEQPVIGRRMFAGVFVRTGFMVCVPLFIILTGYLMRNKQLNRKYYSKCAKTLIVYLLASVACLVYQAVRTGAYSIKNSIKEILGFTAAPYSWYIEMYIGLFLIIPFLNILYNGLPTKKSKQILIITMLVLTALPRIINVYCFSDLGWWFNPSSSQEYDKLMPGWWTTIYPIAYYYIGAYISEYKINIGTVRNILLIIATFFLNGLYNCWRSGGVKFIWGPWCDWGSLFNVVFSVLIFLFFINIDYSKMPCFLKKVIIFISNLSLGIYLVSWIFDKIFYTILNSHILNAPQRMSYFPIIVPAVFVCSLALSGIIELIYMLMMYIFGKIKSGISKG